MQTKPHPAQIEIAGKVYQLERLDPDPEVASVAWRLSYYRKVKKTGETEHIVWDVHQDEFGIHCDCEDGTYRHEQTGETCCKHAAALIGLGLL